MGGCVDCVLSLTILLAFAYYDNYDMFWKYQTVEQSNLLSICYLDCYVVSLLFARTRNFVARFRSLNCNCGPDASEWFAIEAQHTDRLRAAVLKEFSVDIFRCEGSWFPSEAWLLAAGIPFQHGQCGASDFILYIIYYI